MPPSDEKEIESMASVRVPAIPSIDLGSFLAGTRAERKLIAAHVDEICKSIGFLVIENHGIPINVVDDAWSAATAFFDLPLDEKLKSKPTDANCPRGYFPLAAEALAKSLGVETPPDIKESFGIGPMHAPPYAMAADEFEFHYGENYWPALPTEFRSTMTRYFDAMSILGSRVLQLFAAALELPDNFFEKFHTHPMCALRCINYPRSDAPLLPMQKGAGEHSDYGSITILKSDPDVPGLEIRMPSGRWARAPLVKDAFVVNIGDMMARWTNDRWVSTLHRVIQPGATRGGADRRQSIPFFHNTNFDAKIECIPTCLRPGERPKYAPVLAGQYLVERFTAAVN
jgi:isopenicillin N synthase-like dioxygenase